jgi:hypothetical protein
MGKLSEIDAMKNNIETILFAADQQGSDLHRRIDALVERRACSRDMVAEIGAIVEAAFVLGRTAR